MSKNSGVKNGRVMGKKLICCRFFYTFKLRAHDLVEAGCTLVQSNF